MTGRKGGMDRRGGVRQVERRLREGEEEVEGRWRNGDREAWLKERERLESRKGN